MVQRSDLSVPKNTDVRRVPVKVGLEITLMGILVKTVDQGVDGSLLVISGAMVGSSASEIATALRELAEPITLLITAIGDVKNSSIALFVRSTLITDHKPQCGRSSAPRFDHGRTRAGCGPCHQIRTNFAPQFARLCALRVPAGLKGPLSREARVWAL